MIFLKKKKMRKKSDKVQQIVEFQKRQRTLQEAIDHLQDLVDRGQITHMNIIVRNDVSMGYIPACDDRNYLRNEILYDMKQWEFDYLSEFRS